MSEIIVENNNEFQWFRLKPPIYLSFKESPTDRDYVMGFPRNFKNLKYNS